jgi:hypothetical protein
MKRPLGCLTGTALLTAVASIVVTIVLAVATGNDIFSPGPLSADAGQAIGGVRSHAELAGRCDACHAEPWAMDRMGDRCLACHTAVASEISAGTGLHGLFGSGQCRDCHTDHQGPDGELTIADPAGFPHDRTGYALTAHAPGNAGGTFACGDCHPASLATFSETTCLECHQSGDPVAMTPHVATFGPACLSCHDGIDTYGAAFDHRTYPLEGGHEEAGCDGCHVGARNLFALRETSTDCIACHRADDIHEARLGEDCGACHAPTGWDGATIDHDLTRFKLTGRHGGTACLACHVDRQWTGIGTTCVACHGRDDPHAGRFGTDCGACHTTSDWDDVTFDHSRTSFPLTGAHRQAACQSCHGSGAFRDAPTACAACHSRPASHPGAFNGCAACHTTRAWLPASFDVAHRFSIRHGDARGVCSRCHPATWTDYTCAACHSRTKMAEHHKEIPGFSQTTCAVCHPTGRDD